MLSYIVTPDRLDLTAVGFVSEDEAVGVFQKIRDDPEVAPGLPWLMDLRQYDHTSMGAVELQPRVMRMMDIVGPKLGRLWALVIDSQVGHVLKGRLLQQLVQEDDATVMLFTDVDEAEDWLDAMTNREK